VHLRCIPAYRQDFSATLDIWLSAGYHQSAAFWATEKKVQILAVAFATILNQLKECTTSQPVPFSKCNIDLWLTVSSEYSMASTTAEVRKTDKHNVDQLVVTYWQA
jgi:hypothetical protein